MTTRLARYTVLIATCLLVTSCGTMPDATQTTSLPEATSTTTLPDVRCVMPPATERAAGSDLQVTVEPNPVSAGAEVTLAVRLQNSTPDMSVGASAEWQCWNGERWVGTHQLLRDWTDGGPRAIEVPPGATTTVPGIGLPVPNTFRVIVPDVSVGVYRIADTAVSGGESVTGFVIVEVAPG